MPQTTHRLDATDLQEHGTYALRRALDRLARRSDRLVTRPVGLDDHRSPLWMAVRPWVGRADRT